MGMTLAFEVEPLSPRRPHYRSEEELCEGCEECGCPYDDDGHCPDCDRREQAAIDAADRAEEARDGLL